MCTCAGGSAATGAACTAHDGELCSACGSGYFLHGPMGAFTASLGAMNGVPDRSYAFLKMRATSASGSYSAMMVARCGSVGMQPVCDHPKWCQADRKALYLGQSEYISSFPHRLNSELMPRGFGAIVGRWAGLCSYAADGHGNDAMCNVPSDGHSWQSLGTNPGFMCGVVGSGSRTCSEVNKCDADEYVAVAPTPTTPGTCASHTVCNEHQYESRAASATSDRQCALKQCTCAGGVAAAGAACAAHSTEQCASCSAGRSTAIASIKQDIGCGQ